MNLHKVTIHNFRSIQNTSFDLQKYSLLIGENNAGKSNIITALRIFYENDVKFDLKIDIPKNGDFDGESWIELEYKTTTDEQDSLKDEYKSTDNILKVRRYYKSKDAELVKTGQSNIYAYEGGQLSKNLFYGAKNISQAKLGNILFIPELSKSDDTLKMSGPSPLRNMIDFVMQKVIKTSKTYNVLTESFEKFNKEFKQESSEDGFSIKELTDEINSNVKDWGILFGLDINQITPDNIIKNLVSHYIEDSQLNNERISINCFGQGLQRHLIYTLIRVGAKYSEKKIQKKKEFSPDFTLILFEEPETFLHPTQQEFLNIDLYNLSKEDTQQIICCTHSSIFVSKNIERIPSLLRVQKQSGITSVYQITDDELSDLFNQNNSLYKTFADKLTDPTVDDGIKSAITKGKLAQDASDEEQILFEESLKYFLWIDSERANSFFAKHVIICEGATEKVLFDKLINNEWVDLKTKHLYFLDAMGKFNIHRYMNLFGQLGINHSVIFDKDNDTAIQGIVNNYLSSKKNTFTKNMYSFDEDIEKYLEIAKPNENRLKPLNILSHLTKGEIKESKLDALKQVLINLIS